MARCTIRASRWIENPKGAVQVKIRNKSKKKIIESKKDHQRSLKKEKTRIILYDFQRRTCDYHLKELRGS